MTREDADADDDPEALPEGVGRAEAVDLGQPDRGQQARERQQVRVGVRDGEPGDDVRDQVQAEEDQRVRDRPGRDHRLPRDVDAREAEAGDDADRDQVDELAVPRGQAQGTTSRLVLLDGGPSARS